MGDPLSLQNIDPVETPSDLYQSTNSIYACVTLSYLSLGC